METKKYVLIITTFTAGRAGALEAALKCAHGWRAKGFIPLARCLDKDFRPDEPKSLEELRCFEIDVMRRKFPDKVELIDSEQPNMQEVAGIAKQYGYVASAELPSA